MRSAREGVGRGNAATKSNSGVPKACGGRKAMASRPTVGKGPSRDALSHDPCATTLVGNPLLKTYDFFDSKRCASGYSQRASGRASLGQRVVFVGDSPHMPPATAVAARPWSGS